MSNEPRVREDEPREEMARQRANDPQHEREAITALEGRLGEALTPHPTELPIDGPRTLWHGAKCVAWVGSPARIRDELAGIARAAAHPCAPIVVASTETALALEPIEGPIPDPIEALVAAMPKRIVTTEASIGEHLLALGGPVSVARALARALSRSRADRLLARRITIATGVGPILGGIDPRWLRRAKSGRAIALSMRHAQAEGWGALDLAAADAHGLADLRAAHAEAVGSEHANAAYDLALLALVAREIVLAKGEAVEIASERAKEIAARLVEREPDHVKVRVEVPPLLEPHRARWEGDEITASQARWLLRELDGLHIGGGTIHVHVDPPLRAGRAAPPWRSNDERRRELFTLWERGIRSDDEGLFSATAEPLANAMVEGAKGVVIDGTCGIGSITIALARRPEVEQVIAVDVDAARLSMAKHNAALYDVTHKIRFVHGDVREVALQERANLLVLDPPWGGRDYDRSRMTLRDLGLDIRPLISTFRNRLILKLPRSLDVAELPDFKFEPAIDARGVIKFLIARR